MQALSSFFVGFGQKAAGQTVAGASLLVQHAARVAGEAIVDVHRRGGRLERVGRMLGGRAIDGTDQNGQRQRGRNEVQQHLLGEWAIALGLVYKYLRVIFSEAIHHDL